MESALKKQEQDFDEVYGNISKLYDQAENILHIISDDEIPDGEEFINDVENVVGQIEEAANILAEDLSKIIETGDEPTNVMKIRVNAALKKILNIIDEYKVKARLQGN